MAPKALGGLALSLCSILAHCTPATQASSPCQEIRWRQQALHLGVAPCLQDDRAHIVRAAEGVWTEDWRSTGRMSGAPYAAAAVSWAGFQGPPSSTASAPRELGWAVDRAGCVRTSHSSLTGQQMVPGNSADLVAAPQGPHPGMGSKRGEQRWMAGQGSGSTAWQEPWGSLPSSHFPPPTP